MQMCAVPMQMSHLDGFDHNINLGQLLFSMKGCVQASFASMCKLFGVVKER